VICPSCDAKTHTLESRPAEDGSAVRRRRECVECGHRFTSFERREREPAWVIKRGGERQSFDRVKLRASLLRAAHKRPVAPSSLERLVDQIEADAERSGGEIDSARVGELCLDGLRGLDLGAWLQFVAVYRQLADLDSVRAELDRIDAADITGNSGNSSAAIRGASQKPRKQRISSPGSVRAKEDDARLPAETE
jgi:transcriptional repressor NrdR